MGSEVGPARRCSLKVVSTGTGAKRLRAGVGCVILCAGKMAVGMEWQRGQRESVGTGGKRILESRNG